MVKQISNTPVFDFVLKNVFSKNQINTFNPFWEWENRYRIWPNNSLIKHPTEKDASGILTIKKTLKSENLFELTVKQHLQLEEESHFYSAHVLKASILCKADAFATPIQWEWTSSYKHNKSNTEILRLQETANYKDGRIERETRNGVFHVAIQGHFCLEWCLLEAVQRSQTVFEYPFTVFEKFSRLKSNQQITKIGNNNDSLYKEFHRLTRYIRNNNGISHQEYWLNEHNRLISFNDVNRIYVLEQSDSKNTKNLKNFNIQKI